MEKYIKIMAVALSSLIAVSIYNYTNLGYIKSILLGCIIGVLIGIAVRLYYKNK
jgi:hypothetical protein